MVGLENFSQFNADLFYKLFGNYVRQKRSSLNLSFEDLSAKIYEFSSEDLKLIEAGSKTLTENQFNLLTEELKLDPSEVLNISRITQVQQIMELSREINELYPK